MLSITYKLKFFMLSVAMLNVVMLSVVLLNAVVQFLDLQRYWNCNSWFKLYLLYPKFTKN